MLFLCSKTYCCYDITTNKFTCSDNELNKRVLKQGGDGPVEKHSSLLHEKINITTTNSVFLKNNHAVASYEQLKKRVSYFEPKRIVYSDENNTQPLNL